MECEIEGCEFLCSHVLGPICMQSILDRLVKTSPVPAMVRVALENILSPDFIDGIFRSTAAIQTQRQLLFSSIVEVMCLVVCRVKPTVNAAYVHLEKLLDVSVKSVYNKINKVEPEVSRQLVCQTASRVKAVIDELAVFNDSPIPGYEVRILDGNHHPASEHRLMVLRDVAAGPLPGLSLVVFDPVRGIVVDCLPCEDGHKQERALIPDVLNDIEAGTVWIADRNFCTCAFMFELALHKAHFVVRRHAKTCIEVKGLPVACGRVETGTVSEQTVEVIDVNGHRLSCRLITLALDQPTRDGDHQIQILTNLPASVSALIVAESYRSRWKIENVNLELMKHFASEQTSLGNPPATLFAFCVAIVAFNMLQIVHASLRAAHGEEATKDKISNYYLAHALQSGWESTYMIEDEFWIMKYSHSTPKQLAAELIRIAKYVNLRQFRKSKRGPKKPPTPRTRFKGTPHVSTYQLLNNMVESDEINS